MKNTLVKKYRIKKDNIKIINFGIDTNYFVKKKFSFNYAKTIRYNKKNLTVVSLRNHYKGYDIPTLIKAVKLASKKIKITCLIYSSGKLTNYYAQLIQKLNLKDNILLMGGFNQKKLLDIFSITDLYISTSLSDGGIAASTAEAMSCEVPCAITDNSDNKYWIHDNINGYLFKNKSVLQLSSILINFDKEKSKNFGLLARKKILKFNSYNQEMNKMLKFYI